MEKIFLIIFALSITFFIIILNRFLKKKKYLLNYTGLIHQKLSGSREIPLSGGIFIFIVCLIYFINLNLTLSVFLSIIFFFRITRRFRF